MPYQTIDEVNTSEGLHTFMVYANDIVPIFTPMLLFVLFIVAFMASYFSTLRLRGDANASASFAVSGMFIALVSVFMSFIPGLINLTTMVACFGVALIGFLWLILDRNN